MNIIGNLINIKQNLGRFLIPSLNGIGLPASARAIPTKSIDDFYRQCSAPPMSKFYVALPAGRPLLMPPDSRVKLSSPELMFRGDDRSPDTIFSNGLQPPLLSSYVRQRPAYRPDPGDLEPGSAVSLTRDVEVAATFPLELREADFLADTFVYLLAVDDYYDVHHVQVDRTFRNWKRPVRRDPWKEVRGVSLAFTRIPGADDHHCRHFIFAHEIACMGIPPKHVLGALRVHRERSNGRDYMDGTKFQVEEVIWNPAASCQLELAQREAFEKLEGSSLTAPCAFDYDLPQHGYRHTGEDVDWQPPAPEEALPRKEPSSDEAAGGEGR